MVVERAMGSTAPLPSEDFGSSQQRSAGLTSLCCLALWLLLLLVRSRSSAALATDATTDDNPSKQPAAEPQL